MEFPCILVPKIVSEYVTDCCKVNSVTNTDTFPILRINDCNDNVGQAKYATKIVIEYDQEIPQS